MRQARYSDEVPGTSVNYGDVTVTSQQQKTVLAAGAKYTINENRAAGLVDRILKGARHGG